jgi:RNA polymerase sigma-54 factor
MAGGMKQTLNLGLSLRMTPQLQQAIKLLQLSRMELETAVRTELDENPILEETLEIKEEDVKRVRDAASEVEGGAEQNIQDPKSQDEFDWESYYEHNNKPMQQSIASQDELMSFENMISTQQSLHDNLNWQVKMSDF